MYTEEELEAIIARLKGKEALKVVDEELEEYNWDINLKPQYKNEYKILILRIMKREWEWIRATHASGTEIMSMSARDKRGLVYEFRFRSKFQNAGCKPKRWASREVWWGEDYVKANDEFKEGMIIAYIAKLPVSSVYDDCYMDQFMILK